ncbi:hypothetical protein Dsin_015563 [Dipteronia sinensis]|uniref:Reverse transcriptase zinc-binding domain-containing protein n=1 Tax=Dipteronia sinensis TaxID=43782 RepID=A0AAE0ACN8_9ROSI|nr:hypothetical protein Dsin_015563 [Dipteronia sinensis]
MAAYCQPKKVLMVLMCGTTLSGPKLDINATVEQLISPSDDWNVQLIKHNFISEDRKDILKIPIVSRNRADNLLWHYNENGQFSVKSGHWLGCRLDNMTGPSNISPLTSWWNRFWRVKIPMKVKVFIWKACQNWFPTKINIGRRGVITNGVYSELFCVVVWRIWFCRNSALHEAKKFKIEKVVSWSINFLQEFRSSNTAVTKEVVIGNKMGSRWTPPANDAFKANCNAVLDQVNGRVGVGVMNND